MGLNGKAVLVTGATSGIGEATARAHAAAKANVIITGRGVQRGESLGHSLTSNGHYTRCVRADLEKSEDVERLAAEVGDIDILVNNAGVFSFGPTHEVASEAFDATYALNVRAPFFLTAALAPRMAANGGGAIVNITTTVANFGMLGMSLYGSTKAALTLLTEAWAAGYGPKGARVSAVTPGPARTPAPEPMGDELDELAATLPLSRPATSEEIGAAAVFLGSDEASYIDGAVLAVDCGHTAI